MPDNVALGRWRERLRPGERAMVEFVGVDPALHETVEATARHAEQSMP